MLLFIAAPFLVRRFVEPAVESRAAVWIHFALLVSVALMTLGLSVFLFLFLAPESVTGGLGAACTHGPYCPRVLPSWAQFTLWLSVTAFMVWMTARMGWTVFTALRAGRRVRRAVLASAVSLQTGLPHPVYEVADRSVFAWTVGYRRSLILISRGLHESLPAEELGVVLAHEAAHASGRDNLLLLVSRAVEKALFFLPGVPQAHAGVRRCIEIAADAAASRGAGDLLVATSVSHVARLQFHATHVSSTEAQPVGAAFAHKELVVERVQHLVDDRRPTPSRRRLLCGIAALALVLTVFCTSLYTVTGNGLTGDAGSATCTESVSA